MNNRRVYLLSAAVTACLSFAGAVINAKLPGDGERPLSPPASTAVIDGCSVTGIIAQKEDTAYAEFEVTNTTASAVSVDFYYAVSYTSPMAAMSRMISLPGILTNGHYTVSVAAGETWTDRVAVMKQPTNTASRAGSGLKLVRPATNGVTSASSSVDALPGEPVPAAETEESGFWSLTISRTAIAKVAGWGGVPPSPVGKVQLDAGSVVLTTVDVPQTMAIPDDGS